MIVETTKTYADWFDSLRDERAKARMAVRIRKIETFDYLGDCQPVGDKVYELRFDFGPGYRIYFYYENQRIILLLCGGDKSTQKNDIHKAKFLLKKGVGHD
jgi:putative addiction module killer protein